jgi:RNA polymerase sigma-70 factor (ECF subfamily)
VQAHGKMNSTDINLSDSDNSLMKRLRKKDEEAWVLLFKEYYQPLLSFASHYLWDKESAEDIVQDVIIKLYENAGKIDINTSLKSYLFRAVKNRCFNYLRDHQVRDTHKQGMLEAHLWSNTVDAFDDTPMLEWLYKIIKDLPQACQQVVNLRLKNGSKFSEIATTLNITENYAKVQMSRAVRFMREEFEKYKMDDWER